VTDAALAITVDGTTHTIRMGNLTAIDAKDFRAAVGVSLTQAMSEGSTDLDVVAGLVWLARRKRERGLPYAKVAAAMNYETQMDVVEPGDEGDETDDADPGEA
jgi:hypothetical protein